ncbi:3-deoxy-D-manno-octulosonic acid transferase [Olivibacter sitiensis]|uniref:3-deoxy-D-manno-octulosonic acid transferase n=1 Tax=Olivibacter sitiensis TaxID=376470 RepID=UPI0004027526|nr:glycosyltransferase N-terminal domain-containing protein [Olivibacter sitiensis]
MLYNVIVYLGQLFLWLVKPFNKRVRVWKNGRDGLLNLVEKEVDSSKKHVWFHFASLGEFEQGRPVLEAFKKRCPDKPLVATFFSPSGYEIRKNYSEVNHVFYLPADTPGNARRFVKAINPEMVFFVKYELWYNHFKQIKSHGAKLYLISAIFRPSQFFFKWYGKPFRDVLFFVDHYFVQNQESAQLLQRIGIRQISLTGDTRFDRVAGLSSRERSLPVIEQFVSGSKVLVAGSTWLPDEELLLSLHQVYPEWKLIIAPHMVTPQHIKEIAMRFTDNVLYSVLNGYVRSVGAIGKVYDMRGQDEENSVRSEKYDESSFEVSGNDWEKQLNARKPNVLIIDNIGMLSAIYAYADIAYIGGGFGEGIHNTLEAAAYGVPILFGPRYEKFQEAKDLIQAKAAFCVENIHDVVNVLDHLQKDDERNEIGKRAYGYVQQQAGATEKILSYVLGREEV